MASYGDGCVDDQFSEILLVIWWNFFFLTKLFWGDFFFFFLAKTFFHLAKLHLANFIWQNFIYRRLVTPILSWLCQVLLPVASIFWNGYRNTHSLSYIIDSNSSSKKPSKGSGKQVVFHGEWSVFKTIEKWLDGRKLWP